MALFEIGPEVFEKLPTLCVGLERVLADENSPYAAPEKYRVGYFRKFSHGSE